jgi:hypothetical protein
MIMQKLKLEKLKLKLKLFGLNCSAQSFLLEKFKLLPYRMRLCFRLNIFCHKVVKKIFLSSFSNNLLFKNNCCNLTSCNGNCSRRKELVFVPDIRTNFGRQSFGYFLPKLLNCIIKDNYILDVKEFCLYLKNNLTSLFESFIKNFF